MKIWESGKFFMILLRLLRYLTWDTEMPICYQKSLPRLLAELIDHFRTSQSLSNVR